MGESVKLCACLCWSDWGRRNGMVNGVVRVLFMPKGDSCPNILVGEERKKAEGLLGRSVSERWLSRFGWLRQLIVSEEDGQFGNRKF